MYQPCAICSIPVRVYPFMLRTRKTITCSRTCAGLAHRQLFAERRSIIHRPCPICGTVYEASATEFQRGKETTCSRQCSYRLRMQTRKSPHDKLRKSDEHKQAKRRQKNAAYRARHREELNRRQAAYIKANPEIAYLAQERRRARKAAAPANDLTRRQWRAIKAAFDNRCAYCGLHFQRLTMDHVIPLCKGGGNTASNVVPACHSCNCRKATSLLTPRFLPKDPDYLIKI